MNLFNQNNKEILEEQKAYKNIHKRNAILIYDPKIFKKDSEIQNNSITDEDEYNKEIYNDSILSYKLFFNDENVIVHSKSSFYSLEGKNKNIYMHNNTKNNIQNQNLNLDTNKIFQEYQSSNTIDKDQIEFMKIVNNFNEVHRKTIIKNIENFGKNYDKTNSNSNMKKNEISKFSIQKRKNNNLRNHMKSPSQPCNRKNNEEESIYKEAKNIIMNKDKKLDISSISKNLFNKNQQYLTNINNKNKEISKKNTFIIMDTNKRIILEDNIGPNTSKFSKYNNSNNKNNKRKMNDCLDRKSKSMIDEDINFNEKVEKKVEIRKNSPLIPQRITKRKNLILEEEEVDKNKISSIKRIEIDIGMKKRGNIYNNKQAYDNYKNMNYNQKSKDKDKENDKKRKFIYSNINSRNKDNNTSEYQKNNDSNYSNTNSIFIYSNTRKHNLNNYNVSSIKPYNKKPIINISINKNERDNKNRSLINNHRKISLNQQKEPENIKLKTPIFHTRQGSGQNMLKEQKNININSAQSCTNINQINNLKKQPTNTENNEPKSKRRNNIKRNLNIKQGKIDLFQNDYNLYLKNRINHNQKNSNWKKNPLSNISSARNEEKSSYSKNDEISTERSIVTKFSLVNNKNEGEKMIINTSKSQNNYNLNNLELNSKYIKNSLKRIVNYAIKNTTKNFEKDNNNNAKDENKKIYIYEQNHQNHFGRKNHNYHVIRSTSQDNNIKLKNKNNEPLQLKIENKISRIVTSTSMDNLKGTRRNKDIGNIKTIT